MKRIASYLLIIIFFLSSSLVGQTWIQKLPAAKKPAERFDAVAFSNGNFGFIATGNEFPSLKDTWRYDPSQRSWTQVSDFTGTARYQSFAFTVDSFAYLGAGTNNSVEFNDFYSYNMNNDTWTLQGVYPGTGRRHCFAASTNGKGYVGGGRTGMFGSFTIYDDFYEYDPVLNSWISLANFPFGNRSNGISFSYADTIYFGLGRNGNVLYNDLWAYSINDSTWTQKANFPGLAREDAIAVHRNGEILVGGGQSNIQVHNTLEDFYAYNPVTNQWTAAASLTSRSYHSSVSFSLQNEAYIFGGRRIYNIWEDELYKYSSDYWVKIDSTPNHREGVLGFSHSDAGYIIGGQSPFGHPYKDLWKYDAQSNEWTNLRGYPGNPGVNGIVFTIDSFAYAGLGRTWGWHSKEFYRYSIAHDRWDSLPDYPGSGSFHIFYASTNGKAYVGGGAARSHSTGFSYHQDFYEYDPVTDTWRALPNLPFGKRWGGISFAVADTVYFGFGLNDTNVYQNDLWAYSVKDSTWSQKSSLTRGNSRQFVQAVGHQVIVGGGVGNPFVREYHEYDARLDQWTFIGNFPALARQVSASFQIKGNVYLFGGAGNGGYLNRFGDLWEYNGLYTSDLKTNQTVKNNSVFPNPTNGELYVSVKEVSNFYLYDLSGKRVANYRINESSNLNLSRLDPGTYLYTIETNNSVERGKLVLSK